MGNFLDGIFVRSNNIVNLRFSTCTYLTKGWDYWVVADQRDVVSFTAFPELLESGDLLSRDALKSPHIMILALLYCHNFPPFVDQFRILGVSLAGPFHRGVCCDVH